MAIVRGGVREVFWGHLGENGVWISTKLPRRRILLRGHDALFIGLGRWRFRIMKPRR